MNMRSNFPFTSYDFYAYLTSGTLLLTICDYVFNNATFFGKDEWSFVQVVAGIAFAYVVGHIVASFAQLFLERWLVFQLLSKPSQIQLGLKTPNRVEEALGALVGRYYEPLSPSTRTKILETAAGAFNKDVSSITDSEDVFQLGYQRSLSNSVTRDRMDDFRNQYGLCRNLAFVGLVSVAFLVWKASVDEAQYEWLLVVGAGILALGMFVRYVKFLSSFHAEVLRSTLSDK